jgi:hypothetical protein
VWTLGLGALPKPDCQNPASLNAWLRMCCPGYVPDPNLLGTSPGPRDNSPPLGRGGCPRGLSRPTIGSSQGVTISDNGLGLASPSYESIAR